MPEPDDLVPLPTMPWEERPSELPLVVEEVRTALWRCSGNVTEAAKLLKTPTIRLRNFIRNSPRLSAEEQEAREQIVDTAEDVVKEALLDPDRQDTMARFVLGSIGRGRGWGQGNPSVKINSSGPLNITWSDGSSVSMQDSQTIEGEVVERSDK